jgi:predicted DNA-binding transcriptional regulator AlpA
MHASLPTERRFVRTKPAADHCGVSESNLNKRRVRGQPPPFIKLGKTVVYDTRDLDDWVASCRRQSTSEAPAPTSSHRRHGSAATSVPRRAPRPSSALTSRPCGGGKRRGTATSDNRRR